MHIGLRPARRQVLRDREVSEFHAVMERSLALAVPRVGLRPARAEALNDGDVARAAGVGQRRRRRFAKGCRCPLSSTGVDALSCGVEPRTPLRIGPRLAKPRPVCLARARPGQRMVTAKKPF